MANLHSRFMEAGLPAEVARTPIARTPYGAGATQIFQMTIRKAGKGEEGPRERFQIFRGHRANRVEVLGIDQGLQQLVLFVHEPAREFEERLRVGREAWRVEKCKTPARKRHFLMGMDERHLFIAELPRPATTVRDAHEALKTGELVSAGSRGGNVVRQGEWFFLVPTAAELAALEEAVGKTRAGVYQKAPIGPVFEAPVAPRWVRASANGRFRQAAGNPHVADEIVVLRGETEGEGRRVFARGAVRHIEHKTIVLDGWMKVFRNAEAATSAGPSASVGWVD